ncbi:MAG: FHA domain-containing protein [Boseongicola sp.]|nr:FHA domain-containing protein [Boseongicola sp.]
MWPSCHDFGAHNSVATLWAESHEINASKGTIWVARNEIDPEITQMLGKIFGRKGDKPKKDVAIIHQSVPDEVLNIEPPHPETLDTSWMDATNVVDKPKPAKSAVAPKPQARQVKPEPKSVEKAKAPVAPSATANANAQSGARYPHGWLVVVEGPGIGEWFVLESGVSQIGQAEGQTIPLRFGDSSLAAECHAQLTYDEAQHAFVLDEAGESGVRINGVVASRPTTLRDGDIITAGGTSLRLVALCTPNFNWSEARSA